MVSLAQILMNVPQNLMIVTITLGALILTVAGNVNARQESEKNLIFLSC
jgi:hypothetical protein